VPRREESTTVNEMLRTVEKPRQNSHSTWLEKFATRPAQKITHGTAKLDLMEGGLLTSRRMKHEVYRRTS
jgi:hypothetical protein